MVSLSRYVQRLSSHTILSMDTFIADVLDLPPGVPAPQELFEQGSMRIDRLLASPALHVSLAFHDAWTAAFGIAPTRVDFWDFRTRAGAQALNDCLLECTPLRAMPRAQELINRATDAYQKSAAAAAASLEAAYAKLVRKLADRMCCGSDPAVVAASLASEPNLIVAYSALCTKHSGLLEFEAWARAKQADTGVPASAPSTIIEFYQRSSDAIRALDLLRVSPFTGVTLAALPTPAACLTCVEAMRLAVMRDGYLWRQDAGGAIVCTPPSTQQPLWPSTLKNFRTVNMPWTILAAVLPSVMYARAVAVVDRATYQVWQRPSSLTCDILHVVASDVSECVPPVDQSLRVIWASNACPSTVSMSSRDAWLPLPTSYASAAWTEHMRVAMLKSLILLPESDGTLLFQQFVARYADVRCLGTRVFAVPSPEAAEVGEIVIIDSRPNVWSVLSVLVTLDNVQEGKWSVRVFTGEGNHSFMERCLLPHVPSARIQTLEELSGGADSGPFDLERYNNLLKSPSFWQRISAPRALIIQDDGMLVRPGIEDRFLDYTYLGAPWADIPANAQLKVDVPTLVGNGGLSLRNVAAMRDISVTKELEGRRLFNNRLQPLPEDVFYASSVARSCPVNVAEEFAIEQRPPPPQGRPLPIGFHKPWGYLPRDTIATFFSSTLNDAMLRKPSGSPP